MFELNHSITYFLLNIFSKEQTAFFCCYFLKYIFLSPWSSVQGDSTKTEPPDKILYVVFFGFFLVLYLSILSRPP